MSGTLPKHTVRREGTTSVYQLFNESGDLVAAYTTMNMGSVGGVFAIKTGMGWTREMATKAFRAYLGERR